MIPYVVAGIALLAALGGAFGSGWHYGGKNVQADWDAEKVKVADEERKLQAQIDAAEQEAQNKITDMEAAYEAGQSKAKTVYVKVQQRAQSDVVAYPVFGNRACDWPPAVVLLVRGAFANLHAPADTAIAPATVPAPAAAPRGAAGSNLPVADVPARAVEPVRNDARATGGSGQVPGTGTGRPPKPQPRGK